MKFRNRNLFAEINVQQKPAKIKRSKFLYEVGFVPKRCTEKLTPEQNQLITDNIKWILRLYKRAYARYRKIKENHTSFSFQLNENDFE